jgi:hypothetical protein
MDNNKPSKDKIGILDACQPLDTLLVAVAFGTMFPKKAFKGLIQP